MPITLFPLYFLALEFCVGSTTLQLHGVQLGHQQAPTARSPLGAADNPTICPAGRSTNFQPNPSQTKLSSPPLSNKRLGAQKMVHTGDVCWIRGLLNKGGGVWGVSGRPYGQRTHWRPLAVSGTIGAWPIKPPSTPGSASGRGAGRGSIVPRGGDLLCALSCQTAVHSPQA